MFSISYIKSLYDYYFVKQEEKLIFKIIELVPGACPVRGSSEAAGYDFVYAYEEDILVKNGEIKLIPLGIKIQMSKGVYLKAESRSSLALLGLTCTGGVVDSDYLGEYRMILNNNTGKDFIVRKNMRLCQGIFLRHLSPTLIKTDTFEKMTDRNIKGYGSTGLF